MAVKLDEARVRSLKITQNSASPAISFGREGWNYIISPKGSTLAFCPGSAEAAGSCSGPAARLAINYNAIIPGQNNGIIDLGSTTYKWKNIYANTLYGALIIPDQKGGTWTGFKTDKTIYQKMHSVSSGWASPLIQVETPTARTFIYGGHSNETQYGFYLYEKDATSAAWKTYWNLTTGELYHEKGIHASTFYGALSGNATSATKATQDGAGNVITSKYVTLDTTQTISGTKVFSNTINVGNVNTGNGTHMSNQGFGIYVTTSGGWARALAMYYKNTSESHIASPLIGMYGTGETINWMYFGGTSHSDNWLRLTPAATLYTTKGGDLGTSSYKWKNVYATTFTGALSGNATTATTLQTARSINGTSFNGSSDITTSKWGTTRSFTLGNDSSGTVNINGSSNITLNVTNNKMKGYEFISGVTPYVWYTSKMTYENSTPPTSEWYVKIVIDANWTSDYTPLYIVADYSNVSGKLVFNLDSYNSFWTAYLTNYGGSNILAVRRARNSSTGKNEIFLKMAAPKVYNNVTYNGRITVYSPYNISSITTCTASEADTLITLNHGYNSNTGITTSASINGNATSATKDSDGNVIKNTYLKLSGGTMTGNLTLPVGADAYSNASLFFGTKTRIGTSTANVLGIYSTGKIMLRPNDGTLGYSHGFELSTTELIPTKNKTVTLGNTSHYWKEIYAVKVISTTASGGSLAFTESRTGGPSVSFGVGSGNVNHGVYSNTLGKWIVYADASNIYLNGRADTAVALTSNAGSSSLPVYFTGGKPSAVTNIEIKATDTTTKSIKVTNSNGSVGIYTATNQGLYDFSTSTWIIYRPKETTSTYIPAWANTGSAYVPTYHGAYGVPTAVTANSVITNLASTSGASIFAESPRPGVTGTLPVANGGTGNTSLTGNRLAWTENASKITAGYHYANSTKVAINSTSAPTENFYVNGSVRFGLGSSDGVSNKRFIIGTAGNRYLSLGGAGIQAYNTSDAGGILYLQYQGGSISIGQSTSVTAPITIYGAINPGANSTYTLGTSSHNWSTVNARALTSAAALAINSANTTTVSSASTIYLTTNGASSILFSTNATTRGRWSPNGKFIIGTKSESDYNLDVTGTSFFSNTALFDAPPVIRHPGSRYGHIYFQNDDGLQMGAIGHDIGNNTTMKHSRFFFREWSANATNDTGRTEFYETYYLPESTDGLTENKTYNILTTKNTVTVAQGGTGRTSLVTPTVTWTNGSTAGPTLTIKDSLNKSSTAVAIPAASNTISGIITTGAQTIVGAKTIDGIVLKTHRFMHDMTPTAGWYRIAKLDYYQGYFNLLLFFHGGYNHGRPSTAVVHVSGEHSTPSLKQIAGDADSFYTKVRLVGSAAAYYLEIYSNATSGSIGSQYVSFLGVGTISAVYTPATPDGATGTNNAEISLRAMKDTVTFTVADNSATNTGTAVTYDSSSNITLKLPATIKASLTGNADTATKMGSSTTWLYFHNSNELNFGGSNTSTTIYVGYRAMDSRPIPTKFIFGGSNGSADLQVKTIYLGSGTTSYISSTQYTGNAATATAIKTAGTTAQFYRGDNTWSNTIKQTANAQLGIGTDLKIGTARKDLNFDIGNGTGTGINDGYAGGITWGNNTSAYAGIYYQSSGNYGTRLLFATTGSYANGAYARMIIQSNGNVGIGTLSPSDKLTVNGNISGTKVYGAVWNDYAEYRSAETVEPGRVVQESSDGIMKLTVARLQAGCEIISDTFGFAIGETDNCKTPVATSGRVLAYTFEDRDSFELGQAVCSGPNGTVSKMTREEIMMYPERILGTVSEIPTYTTWGTGNVDVNGRIWIRIR